MRNRGLRGGQVAGTSGPTLQARLRALVRGVRSPRETEGCGLAASRPAPHPGPAASPRPRPPTPGPAASWPPPTQRGWGMGGAWAGRGPELDRPAQPTHLGWLGSQAVLSENQSSKGDAWRLRVQISLQAQTPLKLPVPLGSPNEGRQRRGRPGTCSTGGTRGCQDRLVQVDGLERASLLGWKRETPCIPSDEPSP